ncbi:MAG: hypothetical protein ACR2NJ_04065 [Acidimicrobiales bacterium]
MEPGPLLGVHDARSSRMVGFTGAGAVFGRVAPGTHASWTDSTVDPAGQVAINFAGSALHGPEPFSAGGWHGVVAATKGGGGAGTVVVVGTLELGVVTVAPAVGSPAAAATTAAAAIEGANTREVRTR